MKLQQELKNFTQFCKDKKDIITDFYNRVVESKCYVNSPIDYTAYEVVRYYCHDMYKENTYCILYRKYDANDNHILTFGKSGLKSIDIK